VGRCSFAKGDNDFNVIAVKDSDGNFIPEAFVSSKWLNWEPGIDKDCFNQGSPDNKRNR
jgi:hypothetical protein